MKSKHRPAQLLTTSLTLFSVLSLGSGCAVAEYAGDPPLDDSEATDLDEGDGDETSPSPSVVLTTSGGSSSNNGAGGSANGAEDPGTGGNAPLGSGGTSPGTGGASAGTGGATPGTGGMSSTMDPNGCTPLAHQADSGEFGTTGAKCFIVDYTAVMYGWRANNAAGRTVTINGEVVGSGDVSGGPVPWPGSSPYLVEFSSGDTSNTTWAFW